MAVRVINPKSADVVVQKHDRLRRLSGRRAADALGPALINALFFALFAYVATRLVERLEVKAKDLVERSEKLNRDRELLEEEVRRTREIAGRMKIHMYRRQSHYSRELEFWRNTLRKTLGRKDAGLARALIDSIIDGLRTHATRNRVDLDLESLEALAAESGPTPKTDS